MLWQTKKISVSILSRLLAYTMPSAALLKMQCGSESCKNLWKPETSSGIITLGIAISNNQWNNLRLSIGMLHCIGNMNRCFICSTNCSIESTHTYNCLMISGIVAIQLSFIKKCWKTFAFLKLYTGIKWCEWNVWTEENEFVASSYATLVQLINMQCMWKLA